MNERRKQRLTYIDWMRGLACLLMFQTHCYDSWLSDAARSTKFFSWSQLGGTLPAPLFLFLAGISFALATDKLRQRGVAANEIARSTLRRSAEIFGLGLLFRVQEYLLGQPSAPWTDLLRVDLLIMIGLSMMLMALVCRLAAGSGMHAAAASGSGNPRSRAVTILAAAAAALLVALVTPPLWTTWRPRWSPWFLESYINGVHIFREPQPWLFTLFPSSAFAVAGLAVGFVLLTDWARRREAAAAALAGVGGVMMAALGWWLDAQPQQIYAVYDFWHTSPNFFLIRVGLLMGILFGSYAWCRWGAGQWGFSPVIQLGQTSLLVYWVHIEFVYGRFSILKKGQQSLLGASAGLAIITLSMLLLSLVRTRMKDSKVDVWAMFRKRSQRKPVVAGASAP